MSGTSGWRIGEVYLPNPTAFRELAPNDDNFLRPTGPVHALPEVSMTGPVTEAIERFSDFERLTACGVTVGTLGEGCGPTRLRNLATPNAIDDGHIIGTKITCPGCLGAIERQASGASAAAQ
jgi:hypothetical protein